MTPTEICKYCRWAVKNSYGDMICTNKQSWYCTDWVLADDTCDVWEERENKNADKKMR